MQYPMIAQPQYGFAPTMPMMPSMSDMPLAMTTFKEGGMVSNAQKVQSQGRNNDTMLVHMTPREVGGLQALAMQHGGSLTINPKTGLPEAGFLSSILPMVAGAALMATGVGAPMAGLLVGGGTALMTGNLGKGLMAGLGAFGGASLGSALGAAGGVGPTTGPLATGTSEALAAAAPTGTPASVAATTGAALPSAGAPLVSAGPSIGGGFAGSGATLGGGAGTTIGGGGLFTQPATGSGLILDGVGQTIAPPPPTFSQMGRGLSNVIEGTPGARDAFMGKIGGPSGLITKGGSALASTMLDTTSTARNQDNVMPETNIRPYAFDFNPSYELDPEFRYRTGAAGESTSELRYFDPRFTPMGKFKAGTEPGGSFYGTPTEEDYKRYSKNMASGGLASLGKGGLKDGGFVVPADVVSHLGNGSNDAGQNVLSRGLGARPIKGKGDGMSDSIPTSIEGKQPARVADGEAYIPPKNVKKVGAKKLYNMMDKIRQARTGSKKQAPEVNPREFMPA